MNDVLTKVMTKDNNPEIIEFFNSVRHKNKFFTEDSSTITEVGGGHCVIEFYSDESHGNLRGELHGGAYMAIADSAMGTACFGLGKSVCTIEMKSNFLKPAKVGETLRCVAKVEHNGGKTMITTCRMYNNEGNLIFIASGTFFVLQDIDVPVV